MIYNCGTSVILLRYIFVLLLAITASFSYAQTGRFWGKISDEKGEALQGVTITLEPDKHIMQTDQRGLFAIDDLYPGTYRLSASHKDYVTYSDTVVIALGKSVERQIVLQHIRTIAEVVVSAAVTEQESPDQLLKLSRSAMPVQVISRQMIEQMGSRRLDEVLKEQTGMAIVNNITGGNRSVGVQLQGFGSEYVMVLIDGQPIVGRNNGNFDLSRISVSNIERIEIVKGASSCLFGSDALGGAINIITRYGAVEPQAQLALRYGSLNMVDATVDAEAPFAYQRGSVQLSANYYRTDGFNTNPYLSSGQSSPPYQNFDTQARIRYQLGRQTYLGTSIRYGVRRSDMTKNWGDEWQASDQQDEKDVNFSLNLDHTFRSGLRSMSRYYLTDYHVDQANRWQGNDHNSGELSFRQTVHRFEQQFAKSYRNGMSLTGGLGGSMEHMDDKALGDIPVLTTAFAYLQGDKRFWEKLDVRGGLRYDQTSSYGGRINPSFGLQYYINEKISLKTGIGSGFKAPDYRMRYLVFFNPSASYLVIGNDVLRETLQQMQSNGEISEIFHIADQLDQNLKPEQSTSFNFGPQYKPTAQITLEGGVFYHYLKNQIDAIPVATGTGISQLYTYRNLPKATNKGIDVNIQWQLNDKVNIQAGYQYLIAKDLSVADSIRGGNWPYNQNLHNPKTGESPPPKVSDYWGIVNRSRHMLNARVFYHFRPWDVRISLRANYRGKYPFADYNNNQFIDRFDTFVPEHVLLNTFVEKRLLQDRLLLSFTVDNILDFKDQLMPSQPGRMFIGGISYRLQR
ncbi:TonB-dependent receptor [Sphingobacterium sp. DN00404]|uniref:TonB-dependent receptor n=1 Tax=Sphingobacterium micropteri TaxID=2763501 RepID=A0ABR7YL21_9SPHI|nr:TonB-dependent receptor [Sphingobacterium micropteri]MBD1431941.1 TonB-dependent receptor [Sphingobacterium micropteri]